MGNNHTLRGDLRRHIRKALGDVFVREAMEAVAAHALGVEPLRDRIMIGDGAVPAMERRIEAGDLRQRGKAFGNRADRR